MEALNALRILTAPHILSANMKNANVELVSSEMEERVSLVRRLIPINNLRNSKKKYVSFLGNTFSLAEKSWHSGLNCLCYYKYVSRNPSRNSVLRSSNSSAKRAILELGVPPKLNPVGLGWKQYRWPAGNKSRLDEATFFLFCFLVFIFLLSSLIDKMRIRKHT